MGSWGTGILQDDTVLDIIDEFKDYLKEYQSIPDATAKLIENNKDLLNDDDESSLFWIALGKCQWEYGQLDHAVLNKIIDDFNQERGLDIWKEESETDYQKRKKVISDFIKKISEPNNKIKKMPKLIIRKPLFDNGDCLALRINEEYFGAALIIRTDDSSKEYGSNLIVVLDYWDILKPTIDIFTEPKFLHLTYGNWNGALHLSWYSNTGFRNYKDKVIKIGNIDVNNYKDLEGRSYSSWGLMFTLIERQKNAIES
ncbi:hypothetical protein AB6A23_08730 [Paenibacillus tarimensis]